MEGRVKRKDTAPRGERLNLPMLNVMQVCATCAYYVDNGRVPVTGMEIGNCRRNAPSHTGWPQVYALDFCGQHRLAITTSKE
jgi:hypothetical protein